MIQKIPQKYINIPFEPPFEHPFSTHKCPSFNTIYQRPLYDFKRGQSDIMNINSDISISRVIYLISKVIKQKKQDTIPLTFDIPFTQRAHT